MPTRLLALVLLGTLTASAAAGPVVPQGPVPSGLPSRLLVGLREEGSGSWMRDSGVPWDLRYRVLAKGWTEAGPSGAPEGSAALQFMRESRAARFLPVLVFAQLHGEPQGGQSAFYAKTQNATTMHGYFSDFRLLMQRAREYGGPVLVIVEPNGPGLLQEQTQANPQAFAAIAACGLEELTKLPDTVAGWGLAFLQLRKAAGARNVVLALGVSSWAGGRDVLYEAVDAPLQPEVESVVRFLRPLGLGSNATGATYELVASDPLDRDTDYYRLERRTKWSWDPGDDASAESRSFNRYAEWLQHFNQRSGRRWVLWQVPPGRVAPPKDAPRSAALTAMGNLYAEYFFGEGGEAHRQRFTGAGVLALLFGGGPGTTPGPAARTEDLEALKERVQPVLREGALPLPGAGGDAAVARASAPPLPRREEKAPGPEEEAAAPPLPRKVARAPEPEEEAPPLPRKEAQRTSSDEPDEADEADEAPPSAAAPAQAGSAAPRSHSGVAAVTAPPSAATQPETGTGGSAGASGPQASSSATPRDSTSAPGSPRPPEPRPAQDGGAPVASASRSDAGASRSSSGAAALPPSGVSPVPAGSATRPTASAAPSASGASTAAAAPPSPPPAASTATAPSSPPPAASTAAAPSAPPPAASTATAPSPPRPGATASSAPIASAQPGSPGAAAALPPGSGGSGPSEPVALRPPAPTGGSGLPTPPAPRTQADMPPMRTPEEARTPGPAAPQLSVTLSGASSIAMGAVSTLSATVQNAGPAAGGVDVRLEVQDAAGTPVTQQAWTGQAFGPGQSATFAWPWVAPTRPGAYVARVSVSGAGRGPRVQSAPLALTVRPPVGTQAGPAAPPAPTPPANAAQYDFEGSLEGWTTRGSAAGAPFPSGAQAFAGTRSLGVSFTGQAGTASVLVPAPRVEGGRRVRFQVWVPAGSALSSVQAFVQEGPEAAWRYTGAFRSAQQLTPGAWNTLELAVPPGARAPLLELGVEFRTRGGWRGTAYVDAVRW